MTAQGFFITGTDTGVGKTVATACLLSLYQKHRLNVGVMKPIETGVDPECSSAANSDAKFLMEVCQSPDPLSEVCPVQLKIAASPLQAAKMDDRAIDMDRVINGFHRLSDKHDNLMVEGVGGLLVPLKPGYLVCDLIRDLGLPLLVVGKNALGTLNHTLLTLRAAEQAGIAIKGVILNRTEAGGGNAIESGHAGIITGFSGVPVLGEIPFLGQISGKSFTDDLMDEVEAGLDFRKLIEGGNVG